MRKLILLALLVTLTGLGPAQKRLLLQGEPSLEQTIRQQGPTLWLDSTKSEVEPIRHFLLEDNAASTAVVDASGNGNGTLNVNTDTIDAVGKIGGALDFDGAASIIDLGSDVVTTGDYTFCAWAAPDSAGETGSGRFFEGPTSNAEHFAAAADGDLIILSTTIAGSFWSAGTWGHYCARRVGQSRTVWVNGALVYTRADSAASEGIRYLGNRNDSARTFEGDLDDVRIYNRALTAGEIQQIYNQGAGHQSQTLANNSGAVVLDAASNIMSQWSDKSGNARHFTQSTAANMPTWLPTSTGINGRSGVRFNGSASYLTNAINATAYWTVSGKTTIAVIRPADVVSDQFVFRTGSAAYYGLEVGNTADNKAGATNYDGTSDNINGTVLANAPLVMVNTHDGTNLGLSLNGVGASLVASGNTTSLADTIILGAKTTSANFFNGDIAELIAFNKALPSDIRDRIQRGLCKKWGADC